MTKEEKLAATTAKRARAAKAYDAAVRVIVSAVAQAEHMMGASNDALAFLAGCQNNGELARHEWWHEGRREGVRDYALWIARELASKIDADEINELFNKPLEAEDVF